MLLEVPPERRHHLTGLRGEGTDLVLAAELGKDETRGLLLIGPAGRGAFEGVDDLRPGHQVEVVLVGEHRPESCRAEVDTVERFERVGDQEPHVLWAVGGDPVVEDVGGEPGSGRGKEAQGVLGVDVAHDLQDAVEQLGLLAVEGADGQQPGVAPVRGVGDGLEIGQDSGVGAERERLGGHVLLEAAKVEADVVLPVRGQQNEAVAGGTGEVLDQAVKRRPGVLLVDQLPADDLTELLGRHERLGVVGALSSPLQRQRHGAVDRVDVKAVVVQDVGKEVLLLDLTVVDHVVVGREQSGPVLRGLATLLQQQGQDHHLQRGAH